MIQPVESGLSAKRMKKILYLIVLLTVLLRGQEIEARDDFQYWGTFEVAKALGSSWEVFFLPELRARDGASELFYHEYRQGVRWKPSKYFHTSFNYLLVRNEPRRGEPLWEHRGELDLMPKASLGRWEASLRGRIAFGEVQGSSGEEEWQFRLGSRLSYQAKLFGYQFRPYVFHDLFYDVERDSWNQNRIFIGIDFPLGEWKGVKPSFGAYYLLQSVRSVRDDWNSNHIFGTKLTLRL